MKNIKIGTRGSPMALAQTQVIADALKAAHPGIDVQIVTIESRGDKDTVGRLGQHGGKGGAFVTELRDRLTSGEVNLLMHSLKDLPGNEEYYDMQHLFRIGAYLKRDDAHDALIVKVGQTIDSVLQGGVIGTNSVRRKAFLRSRYRGAQVVHFRGAANTRLEKLDGNIPQPLPYGAKEKARRRAGLGKIRVRADWSRRPCVKNIQHR